MKIAVLGIGGVGGVIASALNEKSDELILIARGETKDAIKENGLYVESDVLGVRTIKPALVSDDPQEIGTVDILIIASKNYSLGSAVKQYEDIIGDDTLVIPTQNGFAASKIIKNALDGKGIVADGYIYCFSNIIAPGKIRNVGPMLRMGIGFPDKIKCEKAEYIVKALSDGGLQSVYSDTILKSIWEKYLVMGGNSCVFIYYDSNAGGVKEYPERLEFLRNIYEDIGRLANASRITFTEDIFEKSLEEFKAYHPESISSLYRDIRDGKKDTEFDAVIGEGYLLGKELNVETPFIDKVYHKMRG